MTVVSLERKLGLTSGVALVVANMIGAGVFTTTGFMARDLQGPLPILAVWVIGGLLALAGALCYGELGSMMPRAGGEYAYLTRTYGKPLGFLSGWISLIVGFSAPIAASAMGVGTYLSSAIPALKNIGPGHIPLVGSLGLTLSGPTLVAIAIIATFTTIHALGVALGDRVQVVLTSLKVAIVLTLALAGLAAEKTALTQLLTPSPTPLGGLLGSMAISLIFVSFAYSGWNAAAYMGEEIRRPERNLPRALLLGTALVMTLYLLLNIVFLASGPLAGLAGVVDVGHAAAQRLFGDQISRVMSAAISLALVSSVSAMMMAGPRVYFAMARDKVFFPFFAVPSAKGGAPARSIILQGALASLLALTATFEDLLFTIGFTLNIPSILAVLAVVVLRHKAPNEPRPVRAWGYPLTPLAYAFLSLWIIAFSLYHRPTSALFGLATIVTGLLVYLAFRRK